MSSHLPPLFSLLFRNKPEAVEVTFAGKLCSSLDFSEPRVGLNSLPTPLGRDGVETLQYPQSWGFVGCPTVSLSVCLPWDFPRALSSVVVVLWCVPAT